MDEHRRSTDESGFPGWQNVQMTNILTLRDAGPAMTARRKEVLDSLPSVSEEELERCDEKESCCPICFVPFLAVLASEEMALVNDSPACATEDLGVTRLKNTCGHIFCRKDIREWITRNDSCPTCRRPFIEREAEDSRATPEEAAQLEAIRLEIRRAIQNLGFMFQDSTGVANATVSAGGDEGRSHEFGGMYS